MGAPLFIPDDEKQLVLTEGLRLVHDGASMKSLIALYRQAVEVLPQERRRMPDNVSKVPWFRDAMVAAFQGQPLPAGSANEPTSRSSRVHWTALERQRLCEKAAELVHKKRNLSPREALFQAQAAVLPSNRQRLIRSQHEVSDWFPGGLEACLSVLCARAEQDRLARQAAKEESREVPKLPAEAAVAPLLQDVEVEPVRSPEPTATAQAMVTAFTQHWGGLREHLVNAVASIITEGMERAFRSIAVVEEQPPPENAAEKPAERPVSLRPAPATPAKKSVLVMGLKGAQVGEIESAYGKALDLRFCSVDESKHQLRRMTEAADVTVGMIDFISHSHDEIMKSRSRSYVRSNGGVTSLKQQLSRITEAPQMNGHAA